MTELPARGRRQVAPGGSGRIQIEIALPSWMDVQVLCQLANDLGGSFQFCTYTTCVVAQPTREQHDTWCAMSTGSGDDVEVISILWTQSHRIRLHLALG